jgi:AraC family transcriptional activator of pobA
MKQTDACSISRCNRLLGVKTLHPLVSVVDLHDAENIGRESPDCYSVALLGQSPVIQRLGWQPCDFSDGALLAHPPGVPVSEWLGGGAAAEGRAVLFHRDILAGLPLGRHISDYTYIKYKSTEALFLSAEEWRIMDAAVSAVAAELKWGIDKFSAKILSDRLELLLDLGRRDYHRQFIVRHEANKPLLDATREALDRYLLDGHTRRSGLSCACRFSAQMGLSAAYFNDLISFETGKSWADYVQLRRVQLSKQMVLDAHYTDTRTAYLLGYRSVEQFQQIFQQLTGCTTNEYREGLNTLE